jgi:hypothetical protein
MSLADPRVRLERQGAQVDITFTAMVRMAEDPDSVTYYSTIRRVKLDGLAQHAAIDKLDQEVRGCILDALAHEIDHWLTRDGQQITDPHPEDEVG